VVKSMSVYSNEMEGSFFIYSSDTLYASSGLRTGTFNVEHYTPIKTLEYQKMYYNDSGFR